MATGRLFGWYDQQPSPMLHDQTTNFFGGDSLIPHLWIHSRACRLYLLLILFIFLGGCFGHFLGEHIRWRSTGTFGRFEAFLLDSDTSFFAR